jgi:hypothetical protein
MKKVVKFFPFAPALLPIFALAQASNVDFTWLNSIVTSLDTLVGLLIPVVIALGLLFFIWGLVTYIAASGDEAAKEEGKRKMIWGIIALFVIVAVWGLVSLLGELVGVGQGNAVITPAIP